MPSKVWRSEKIDLIIMDFLKKHGTMKERELLRAISQLIKGLSYEEFLKALMRLELRGLVRVTYHKKTMKLISLAKNSPKEVSV